MQAIGLRQYPPARARVNSFCRTIVLVDIDIVRVVWKNQSILRSLPLVVSPA